MQYSKPKEGVSFGGFLSHKLAFGVEATGLNSQCPSVEVVVTCQGVF